jgi:hypothetical protein
VSECVTGVQEPWVHEYHGTADVGYQSIACVIEMRRSRRRVRPQPPSPLSKKWHAKPAKEWRAALPHLKLLFGDRVPDVL